MKPKEAQHYRLSIEKAKQDYKDGIITATGLVYYTVGIYRKPGQKLRVSDIDGFCCEIGISRAAFYKAISKLKLKGRLNWEVLGGMDLWIPAFNVLEILTGQEVSTNVEILSTDVESQSPNVETLSTDVESESTSVDEQQPQSLSNKDCGASSTISQLFTTSSQLETAEEEVTGEEKEWRAGVNRQLRELRIDPVDVAWIFGKFDRVAIEGAIAYTSQQKWAHKPAAAFVKACKEGLKVEPQVSSDKTVATQLEVCRQYYKLSPPMGLKLAAQYGIDEQMLKGD